MQSLLLLLVFNPDSTLFLWIPWTSLTHNSSFWYPHKLGQDSDFPVLSYILASVSAQSSHL